MGGLPMKPKLLFIYHHQHENYWLDGLYAAIELLRNDFEVTKWNLVNSQTHEDGEFDFVLGWGAFNSPVDQHLQKGLKNLGKKRGLCIAGNTYAPNGASNYDVLFYETKWYRPQINYHPNIVHAFGVNTDIFSQSEYATPIIWDYIGVGALADWKRWDLMKKKKGNRLIVGEYQLGNEMESGRIALDLIKNGVMVSSMVHPLDLANFYHWSRTAYVPCTVYGGGERTLLEARSCGLMIEIEEDNPKLKELLDCPIPTHFDYALKLKEGILSCLS